MAGASGVIKQSFGILETGTDRGGAAGGLRNRRRGSSGGRFPGQGCCVRLPAASGVPPGLA